MTHGFQTWLVSKPVRNTYPRQPLSGADITVKTTSYRSNLATNWNVQWRWFCEYSVLQSRKLLRTFVKEMSLQPFKCKTFPVSKSWESPPICDECCINWVPLKRICNRSRERFKVWAACSACMDSWQVRKWERFIAENLKLWRGFSGQHGFVDNAIPSK